MGIVNYHFLFFLCISIRYAKKNEIRKTYNIHTIANVENIIDIGTSVQLISVDAYKCFSPT